MHKRLILLVLLVYIRTLVFAASQDNWTLDFSFSGSDPSHPPSSFPGLIVQDVVVDADSNIYVADHQSSRVCVFQQDGVFKYSFTTVGSVRLLMFGPDGRLYLSGDYDKSVYVYEKTGAQVRRIGFGQITFTVAGIAVDTNGDIYVTEDDSWSGAGLNARGSVFSSTGTLLRNFGQVGRGAGQITDGRGLTFTADGELLVFAHGTSQYFAKDGTFLRQESNQTGWFCGQGADGTMHFRDSNILRFPDGTSLTFGGNVVGCNPITGMVFTFDYNAQKVYAWRRGFRTLGAVPPKQVPLPGVRSVVQRANGYLDIDYTVNDADSVTVTTAIAAFKQGSGLLRDMIPLNPAAIVEDTATNVGANIPTGQVKRVTWNPVGLNLTSGNLVVEVFVRDGRPNLIDIDFIKLPTSPELTISRSPLIQSDFREAWAWLVIQGDAELSRAPDGEIAGPGGVLFTLSSADGQRTETTAAGRQWLFAKLGVRQATTEELAAARLANSSGAPYQLAPNRKAQMGDRPKEVNEWTFDTSNQYGTEAWWVVPVQ